MMTRLAEQQNQESAAFMQRPLEKGFPPPSLIAIADARYVNKYYYDVNIETWLLVLGAKVVAGINEWHVVEVEEDYGVPVSEPFTHTMDLWANRFADRPFNQLEWMQGKLKSHSEWFKEKFFPTESNSLRVNMMFQSYISRLRFCPSYQALIRLGITLPGVNSPHIASSIINQ